MELRVPADLPEDIDRLIFEAAAEIPSDGLACAYACATVSKQVKLWVEPILYREVEVDRDGLFHRTVTASKSSKPPDFFQKHVKALLFRIRGNSPYNISQILEKCISVQSLALWVGPKMRSPELQKLLTSDVLAPTYLSLVGCLLGEKNENTFSHPIFRNVTHLEVLFDSNTDWDWSSMSGLHRLTHLSLGLHFVTRIIIPTVTTALSYAPAKLRVLVISSAFLSLLADEDVVALNRGEIDSRVVIASGIPEHGSFTLPDAEAIEEWARPSTARLTLWSLAEDIIRRRHGQNSAEGPMA